MIITEKMIADIIAHHDPMALISLGAPLDEYFPEAELILEAFERFKSFDDFHKEVYDIFCFMFDDKLSGQLEDYEELSKEIWQLKVLR